MENNNAGVGEDKISNLPDELIHQILSFVPIKCAMSTCILSKRWKCIPNSISILDFRNWRTPKITENEKELETKRFMNFLDRLLFLHEKTNIQKFYLHLDMYVDESRVNRWISTIMKSQVEEFGLSANGLRTSSFFAPSLFTCDTLTLLDLDFNRIIVERFIIPNTVSFPKLKILRLRSLCFSHETSTTKLLSSSPILEELTLSGLQISAGLLCIATLKHLSITKCYLEKSMVKISAPNLLTIAYSGYLPADFVLNSLPSLVEADINIFRYAQTLGPIKLFEKLSNVKLLKMSGEFFQVTSETDILSTAFNNLIHLEVHSNHTSSGKDSVSTVRTFFRFLQLSTNLESIVFSQSFFISDEDDDGCWSLDPQCSLPHLKSIKFKYFDGEQKVLNVVKLFLKYAGFLETVTIVASPWLSRHQKKQRNIMLSLLMFPKPANCVVKFLMSSEDA